MRGRAEQPPAKDVKNLPHYTAFKIQPLDFIRANAHLIGYCEGNVIKYVCRYKLKNGLEDLDKALNYLQKLREDWLKEHPQK